MEQHEQVLLLAGELRVLTGKLRRRMREQTQMGEITLSQMSVLCRIEREGPATVSSLARAEGMRSQSMGAIVLALTEAEMLSGCADPADGRQTILALTDSCRDWIKASRAAREDWLARTLETRFSATEQDLLVQAVALLRRLTD